MKEWPEDPTETVAFEDLVTPLRKVLGLIYNLDPYENLDGFPDVSAEYDGYNIGRGDRHICLSPEETLKTLQWQWEDQGRDPAELIIALAVQLGAEQGRRVERSTL